MAENVPPSTQYNMQAIGSEQEATSEVQKRGSGTAGMFSDLTVDVRYPQIISEKAFVLIARLGDNA